MIKELEAAGMTISDDAAIEEIETLHAELQRENAEKTPDAEPDAEPAKYSGPCPITPDPKMGDKDPAVIAWYRDNDRDEYERRYSGRVIPTV